MAAWRGEAGQAGERSGQQQGREGGGEGEIPQFDGRVVEHRPSASNPIGGAAAAAASAPADGGGAGDTAPAGGDQRDGGEGQLRRPPRAPGLRRRQAHTAAGRRTGWRRRNGPGVAARRRNGRAGIGRSGCRVGRRRTTGRQGGMKPLPLARERSRRLSAEGEGDRVGTLCLRRPVRRPACRPDHGVCVTRSPSPSSLRCLDLSRSPGEVNPARSAGEVKRTNTAR